MNRWFTQAASAVATTAGRPITFIVSFLTVLVWAVSGPVFGYSNTWQLVINTGTTIITFLMVFLIQNTQNRDSAALQAKLDEIIKSLGNAGDQFVGIEHRKDEDEIKDSAPKPEDPKRD